ncbi:imm11 family protein [Corallococcus soli]|nr:DUF1629 domain-containing protein [Corallococcus soli]
MHEYYVLSTPGDESLCILDKESGELCEMGWMFVEGIRARERYGPSASLAMTDDYPGVKLTDNLINTFGYWVISEALKALLEKEAHTDIEYLPVPIINHKGRRTEGEFFIANPFAIVDCVDLGNSNVDESQMAPGLFGGIYRLALDGTRIPPEARLFRLKQMPKVIIVREDLRAALDAQGLTGLSYIAMGEDCMLV